MADSPWRVRSREIIRNVVESMSPTVDTKTLRRALREAYPFGTREFHPYKIWLDEIRKELAIRYPRLCRKKGNGNHNVALTVQGVVCGWCKGAMCLCCANARDRYEKLIALPGWEMWQSVRDNPAPASVDCVAFADWLTEQGYEDLAGELRGTS